MWMNSPTKKAISSDVIKVGMLMLLENYSELWIMSLKVTVPLFMLIDPPMRFL